MPQYTINDTGKEVSVKKSPPPPKGLKKLEKELVKAIAKALEVAFWLGGGIAIGYIFFS